MKGQLPPLGAVSGGKEGVWAVTRRHYPAPSRSLNPDVVSINHRRSLIDKQRSQSRVHLTNETETLTPVLLEKGYTLINLIGRGGFSVVFKVSQNDTKTEFAAKCIVKNEHTADFSNDTIRAEMEALKSLMHPHIIKLYDFFECKSHSILILQLCNGGTLDRLIKPGKGIARELLLPYMKIILETVAFCHHKKIAHRDIKPHNFFIDSYGRPILGDFGLSKHQLGLQKKCNAFGGSALYRSPEMLQHLPHDPFKTDIWSLGVLFFQMVTGCDPWPTADSRAMRYSIINAEYFMPSTVPPAISHVIRLMLTQDPTKRPSATEILEYPLFKDVHEVNLAHSSTLIKRGPLCSMVDPINNYPKIPSHVFSNIQSSKGFRVFYIRTTKKDEPTETADRESQC